ncbi:putative membrane protein [Streptoalloteichus tenebrarius]|uniref:Membrane protein n=2 Tax=Streptoalloteichus tenebrarius (strain ATCC 17920 / DSM 40477 / JCM 4838 / CBS 697.72 / NBRC 16177 / NCIMB 11028 / NRRL B-12390 / A12253. 1 / ISP 5477) TaxID=1933 RepID=A0ABT1I3E0_STRSD|nr:putative membrane protein [Streptoalloteichus tenebrarius]
MPPAREWVDPAQQDWRRLDPRMLAVKPITEAGKLLLPAVLVLVVGGTDRWKLWAALAGGGLLVVAGVIRWATTRYRISETHVELHSGLFFRQQRSVPRDRLRTVDATSDVVHRLFGLSVVKVGTGRNDKVGEEDELTLDAVSAAEAEHLRQVLLRRTPGTAATAGAEAATPEQETPAEAEPGEVLAAFRPGWLRFAPLTLSGLAAMGALTGTAFQVLNELDVDPVHLGPLRAVAQWLERTPLPLIIAIVVVVLLVVLTAGAMVLYLVQFWGFTLTRESDATLRVRRGLLTTRSVSLEEDRLRGVRISEPLLLRAGGGAKCAAVATGLGTGAGSDTLLPPAPRGDAHDVAATVLAVETAPTTVRLRRHPRIARRRRLVRAVVPVLALAAALGVGAATGHVPYWPCWVALALLPVAVLLGLDRYRNLGHALTERYLVVRSGSLVRQTVALQRTGIVGWRMRQSPFQRLSGLVTLSAVTAAGEGAYEVTDVDLGDGVALADEAVPGLLRPFLETS